MLDAGLVKNSVSYYFQTHDYNPVPAFSGRLDVSGLAGFGANVAGCSGLHLSWFYDNYIYSRLVPFTLNSMNVTVDTVKGIIYTRF